MEKRLQKRIVVKARGSFHVEDFEIRSPNDKTPIEKSEVAAGARDDKDGTRDGKRRRRRRRDLGSPAEVEAMLAEEEAASVVDPEALAGVHATASRYGGRDAERRRCGGRRWRSVVGAVGRRWWRRDADADARAGRHGRAARVGGRGR